ncbi:hypothetical protein BJV74DRAFT_962964 [Russula compacta]|nr:hypothetical protein BJV74DRAFT_962964 [Russula compacta]
MATVPQSPSTPPSRDHSNPDDDEPSKKFLDCPDADMILRSCDSQEFRVLKLFIIKSSRILSEQIQAVSNPSDSATSTNAEILLPVIQLSDNATILSSLLTFVFPVQAALPPTLEETMELLSVAQKFEMEPVLDDIRSRVALLDPPLICPENALRAYALGQTYGLRQEIAQAARITLKFSLTIEDLEDKLDVMSGSFLLELWKYHQRVRTHLASELDLFRTSSACAKIQGCASRTPLGIPSWFDRYITAMSQTPSRFDLIEFQMALMQHVHDSQRTPGQQCSSCASIPVETIRTIWIALTTVVHSCMEKAESTLRILSRETCNTPSIPVQSPPECLDISNADAIIESSDYAHYRVHKSILASSSPIFRSMFSLPQPLDNETVDGLPVVHISEDAELVRALITMLYPISPDIPASYDRILALLAVAQKYDMSAVESAIRAEIRHRSLPAQTRNQVFRAYAIASSKNLPIERESAARQTLNHHMTFDSIGDELSLMEGWALRDLARFRKICRDSLVSCLESYLDVRNDPSRIWIGCPSPRYRQSQSLFMFSNSRPTGEENNPTEGLPTLPMWLFNLLSKQITQMKRNYTSTLIDPSSMRKKYLTALTGHAVQKDCTFCLKVHAQEGEKYCTELSRSLARAQSVARLHSPFQLPVDYLQTLLRSHSQVHVP